MKPEIVLVVAIAENNVIGAHGGLPWRVKADLRRFRQVTMGKPMIMGRKTFDSIGRVLDGRDNIVVTRDAGFVPQEGMLVAHSVPEALTLAEECAAKRGANEICVIGGGEIFSGTMPLAARLDVTHIATSPRGEVVFPAIDPRDWVAVSRTALPESEGDTARAENAIYQRRS